MRKPQHLIEWLKFWRWTTLWQHSYNPIGKQWEYKWFELVICDCGNKKRVSKSDLIRGHSTSCWCYNTEITKKINIVHWDSNTIFYQRRAKAKQRCKCKTNKRYPLYWWRWIKFEWSDYQSFKKDMYDSYLEHSKIYWEHNTTLDRINPDWNYCKENCRWTTMSENCWKNKRQSREYKYGISVEEVSRITWYKEKSLYTLLHKFWWNFDEMVKHITKN